MNRLPRYGYPKDLSELLAVAQPVDGFTASILAMEAYDTTFGLHSHDNDNEPLSLVTMHKKEQFVESGRLRTTMRAFRKHRVAHHYGLSLNEFLSMPRYLNRMILADCEESEKEEAQRAKALADRFGTQPRKS